MKASDWLRRVEGQGQCVTLRELAILELLAIGPLLHKDLCAELALQKPCVTRACQTLRRMGWIESARVKTDTRNVRHSIKPMGLYIITGKSYKEAAR